MIKHPSDPVTPVAVSPAAGRHLSPLEEGGGPGFRKTPETPLDPLTPGIAEGRSGDVGCACGALLLAATATYLLPLLLLLLLLALPLLLLLLPRQVCTADHSEAERASGSLVLWGARGPSPPAS